VGNPCSRAKAGEEKRQESNEDCFVSATEAALICSEELDALFLRILERLRLRMKASKDAWTGRARVSRVKMLVLEATARVLVVSRSCWFDCAFGIDKVRLLFAQLEVGNRVVMGFNTEAKGEASETETDLNQQSTGG
jgi:hypothetical protein